MGFPTGGTCRHTVLGGRLGVSQVACPGKGPVTSYPPPLPTALPWSCSLNRYSHRLVGDVCDPCRSVLQDGQCVRVIKEHTEAIHAIALEQSSPPVLATGGDDRTIRLWNAQVCVSGTG